MLTTLYAPAGPTDFNALLGRETAPSKAGPRVVAAAAALIGALALALATPAPVNAETTAQGACQDPFEASEVELVVGQPVARGLCEPDGRAGGGDKDFLGFTAQAGKSYRVELIERGPGWDGARLHIEDFYALGSQVSFGKESAYSAVTGPMPAGVGGAVFSVEAADASSPDLRTLAGPGFGYTILVTEIEGTPASGPAPTTEAAGTPAASEPVASGGSKKKK